LEIGFSFFLSTFFFAAFLAFLLSHPTMDTITYKDRATKKLVEEKIPSEGLLRWLYANPLGKLTLHSLVKRKAVSVTAGKYMDSKRSQKRIQRFIDLHDLDMSVYKRKNSEAYSTFNDFFYRRIDPVARPIQEGIVSPADGKALAFQNVNEVDTFFVKGSEFTPLSFIQDEAEAKHYEDGALFIVRLAPTDYHRYHFPATGKALASKRVKGHLYSVSPLALRKSLEIFCQNKRELCKLETKEYGNILIADVGATMVGSIYQTYTPGSLVQKGQEKGYFAFGGSTLVLMFEKGKIKFSPDLIENTKNGFETAVKVGETIGS
jgi:phosphatidylserine decarboxylase